MVLRAGKKRSRDVSLYDPVGTDKEGNEIHLLDLIVTEEPEISDQIALQSDIERLHRILSVLTEREHAVIDLRYGLKNQKELTQREVASILHISRSYVSRIEKAALEKLRAALEQPKGAGVGFPSQ